MLSNWTGLKFCILVKSSSNLIIDLQILSVWTGLKILSYGKEVTQGQKILESLPSAILHLSYS